MWIIPLEEWITGKQPQAINREMHYELFFVTGGYLVRRFGRRPVRINRNELHLTLPGQEASVKEASPGIEGYCCVFTGVFLEQVYLKEFPEKDLLYIHSFMQHFPLRLPVKTASRMEYLFRILYELSGQSLTASRLMHTYLMAVIGEMKKVLEDIDPDPVPSKAFQITRQYDELLSRSVRKEPAAGNYARRLGISPNHLNKSVKAATGRTAIEWLNENRLKEAKVLLIRSGKPAGEIARLLGFNDPAVFSRFFKKRTGLTPSTYRQSRE